MLSYLSIVSAILANADYDADAVPDPSIMLLRIASIQIFKMIFYVSISS